MAVVMGLPVKIAEADRLFVLVTFFGADSPFRPVTSVHLRTVAGCMTLARWIASPAEIRVANERRLRTALRPQPMPPAEACCGGTGVKVINGQPEACPCYDGAA